MTRATRVRFKSSVRWTMDDEPQDFLIVHLDDGRVLWVPLRVASKKLLAANTRARDNHRLVARGEGISWPELDEDLSVAGLLRHDDEV